MDSFKIGISISGRVRFSFCFLVISTITVGSGSRRAQAQSATASAVGVVAADGESVPPAPIRDPRAAQCLTNAFSHHGIAPLATLNATITSSITRPDGKVATQITKYLANDVKSETTLDGNTTATVRTAGNGFHIKSGKRLKEAAWITSSSHPSMIIGDVIARHSDATLNEELIAPSPSGEEATLLHVRFSKPHAPSDSRENAIYLWDIFIDPTTFLIVRSESWVFSPRTYSNKSLLVTTYSDYRLISGIMVPFTSISMVDGRVAGTAHVVSADMAATNTIADFN